MCVRVDNELPEECVYLWPFVVCVFLCVSECADVCVHDCVCVCVCTRSVLGASLLTVYR